MSQPLSMLKVVEGLQRVLHDLHDLSEFGAHQPFKGIDLQPILLQYRDYGPSYWRITIQPAGTADVVVEEVEEVEEIPEFEDEPFEGEEDEELERTLEEEFLEGFEEGRKGS